MDLCSSSILLCKPVLASLTCCLCLRLVLGNYTSGIANNGIAKFVTATYQLSV
jgi:hypothetical protein